MKNLARATAERFRNIYKVSPWRSSLLTKIQLPIKTAASRRNEIDEYGNIKKAASRPKARRVSTDILSDRELLLLAFLSLWRADSEFHLAHFDQSEVDEFLGSAVKLWDSPLDISVKLSSTMSIILFSHALPNMVPSDPYFDFHVRYMERSMLVISPGFSEWFSDCEAR